MKIKVSVPATSANIGSGFDALGLAVTLYNTVTFEESEVLDISSADGTRIPRGESNLVYRSAKGLFEKVGKLEFERRGLSITEAQMAGFRANIVPGYAPDEVCGKKVVDVDRRDGVKFYLEGDAWVMMRPSGTEPLVRVYAEAETVDEVRALLDAAEAVVRA